MCRVDCGAGKGSSNLYRAFYDMVMRLGKEKLRVLMKLTEMSVLKYWKELKIPEGQVQYKYVLQTTNKDSPIIN